MSLFLECLYVHLHVLPSGLVIIAHNPNPKIDPRQNPADFLSLISRREAGLLLSKLYLYAQTNRVSFIALPQHPAGAAPLWEKHERRRIGPHRGFLEIQTLISGFFLYKCRLYLKVSLSYCTFYYFEIIQPEDQW